MPRLALMACVAFGLLLIPVSGVQARKLDPPGALVVMAELEGTSLSGVLAPIDPVELSVRPEQYGGTLEVVECVKTGAVEGGQVLLRFNTEWIDEQIDRAELDLKIAKAGFEMSRIEHGAAVTELELKLAHAERSRRMARVALERFVTQERELKIDENKQSMKSAEDRVADQREELVQLEKMYAEDELTEETEEIVLNRARRGLRNAETRLAYRKIRNDWYLDATIPQDYEARRLEVQKQEVSFDKFRKTLALQKQKGDLEHQKATIAMKQRVENLEELVDDRELLTLKAPLAGGVAIPAAFRGGRWAGLGEGDTGYEAGQRVKARQLLFTVFHPQQLRVRATISQAQRNDIEAGMSAILTSSAANGALMGARVERVAKYSSDGKFEVWLSLIEGHDALLAGQSVEIGVYKPVSKSYPSLPASCVVKDGDEHYVNVLGGDSGVERRVVEVEQRFAGLVGLKGVQVGERVQLDPPAPKKKKKAKKDDKKTPEAKSEAKPEAKSEKKNDTEDVAEDETEEEHDDDGDAKKQDAKKEAKK